MNVRSLIHGIGDRVGLRREKALKEGTLQYSTGSVRQVAHRSYKDDNRHVTQEVVDTIMREFRDAFLVPRR